MSYVPAPSPAEVLCANRLLGQSEDRALHRDNTLRNAWVVSCSVGVLVSLLMIGSWMLFEFDAALFLYAEALLLSLTLTTYRLTIWAHRPPTLVLFRRAVRMLGAPGRLPRLWHLLRRAVSYFGLNAFVWKRGGIRWGAHWPIMVGCVMATGVVVPLILGWVWFETPADDFHSYHVMLFGYQLRTIAVDGVEAFIAFHGLVWASLPVVIGTAVAIWRRSHDRGDKATQTFVHDLAPLGALLAIALTGLLMTLSYSWFHGLFHRPLAIVHCVTVVGTLLWIPYSKLIHIPQRVLKLAHMVYAHDAPKQGPGHCRRCGESFANRQQITDLIEIQERLGYRYDCGSSDVQHYQWICPRCRRATLVISQGQRWRRVAANRVPLETGELV